LNKAFEGINKVKFEKDLKITEMISAQGEEVSSCVVVVVVVVAAVVVVVVVVAHVYQPSPPSSSLLIGQAQLLRRSGVGSQ